jgi:hypothetical protein
MLIDGDHAVGVVPDRAGLVVHAVVGGLAVAVDPDVVPEILVGGVEVPPVMGVPCVVILVLIQAERRAGAGPAGIGAGWCRPRHGDDIFSP